MADKLRFAVRKFDPFERAMAKFWKTFQATADSNFEMEFVPMDLEQLYACLFTDNGLLNCA